jgi:hypothetical protein
MRLPGSEITLLPVYFLLYQIDTIYGLVGASP